MANYFIFTETAKLKKKQKPLKHTPGRIRRGKTTIIMFRQFKHGSSLIKNIPENKADFYTTRLSQWR
jgi:hypothetical protein